MNDNASKPDDATCNWIEKDADDRSQLDYGSGSAAISNKYLIHDYADFSPASSLPTFHGVDKISDKTSSQGNVWTVDTDENSREQHLYHCPQLSDITLISLSSIVLRNKKIVWGYQMSYDDYKSTASIKCMGRRTHQRVTILFQINNNGLFHMKLIPNKNIYCAHSTNTTFKEIVWHHRVVYR